MNSPRFIFPLHAKGPRSLYLSCISVPTKGSAKVGQVCNTVEMLGVVTSVGDRTVQIRQIKNERESIPQWNLKRNTVCHVIAITPYHRHTRSPVMPYIVNVIHNRDSRQNRKGKCGNRREGER